MTMKICAPPRRRRRDGETGKKAGEDAQKNGQIFGIINKNAKEAENALALFGETGMMTEKLEPFPNAALGRTEEGGSHDHQRYCPAVRVRSGHRLPGAQRPPGRDAWLH